jgi:hypothetical protein
MRARGRATTAEHTTPLLGQALIYALHMSTLDLQALARATRVRWNEKRLAATRVLSVVWVAKGENWGMDRNKADPAPKMTTPPLRGVLVEVPPRFELGNGGFADRLSPSTNARMSANSNT